MRIVHVVSGSDGRASGIPAVVPVYAKYQSKYITDVTVIDVKKNNVIPKYNNKNTIFIVHGLYLPELIIFFYKYIYKKYNYIIVPHGGLNSFSQKKSHLKKSLVNKSLYRPYFKNALCIQYLCEYEKDNSIYVGNNKSIICGNGVDQLSQNNHKNRDDDIIQFIYIGRLDIYHKGLDLLIKACSLIKKELYSHNVKIDLYGPSENGSADVLNNMINEYGLQKIISLHGDGVFGDEKKQTLINASYFLQTSRLEGLPLGILEALSYGVPIAVTDPVGVNDVIERNNCGFHCKCEIKEIKNMIIKMINNQSEIERFSESAFTASKEFDWDIITKNTIIQYKKLMH